MKHFNHYKMELKPRSELTTGLVLYGETEPAEMQIENLWKIVDRITGEELADPRGDFSEFSTGDRMYPSMMKPEVKRRWNQKNCEWEETKAMHAKLKRMVHAQFMEQNPNLPVVQKLKQTTYGNEIQNEFKKHLSGGGSRLKPRTPQPGTGESTRGMNELRKTADTTPPALPPDEKIEPYKKDIFPFWTVTPQENACEKCQALKGKTYKEKPQRPHPNCKCKIELHTAPNLKRIIVGTLSGFSDMAHLSFKARGDIRVSVRNSGPAIIGGVDITANGDHDATHLRIGNSEDFVFSSSSGDPEDWKVRLIQLTRILHELPRKVFLREFPIFLDF